VRLKRNIIIICAFVVVIAAGIATGLVIRHHNQEAASTRAAATKSSEQPHYPTLLPGNTSIATLGGWQRVSPPDSDPVFAYADTINNVNVTVSEQPLPSSFKSAVDIHVASLAEQYNATKQLHAGSTTVYVGTSAKGPQSVILTEKGVLILIKSQKTISDKAWINYVNSLD